ncbi:hypothetical protein D7Z26_11570 [Cohnella endophytica]|uniref:Uncharacterized protein n=1 Tax=Cohnella endophytica TaxID=2419778 RepID=A0A494XTQ9_9BACL|nr:hypothetical protein [Cohnella endophytica]RKP54021.1 hypothetical protein D7Z26_11570 [Cohnella endophytica]
MKFAGFMFFSTLENLSFFFFIFVLFRFNIRENILKFGVFSVVLSLVSNSLQTEFLQATSSLVQAIFIILFVMFFLRVHLFNATVVVITGYIINFMVQWMTAGLYLHTGILTDLMNTDDGYILQVSSAFLMLVFSLVIWSNKGGFSFVENKSRLKNGRTYIKENKVFIFFLIIAIFVVFVANFLFITISKPPYLLVSIILLSTLVVLLYLTVRRDERND